MTHYGVILFHTTSAVMRAEKLLIKAGYDTKLIPTPRQFSSDCGIALRFTWNQIEQVKATLEKDKVEFDTLHPLDTKDV